MEHVRRIIASPYAKRLARERGLDLAALAGSGPNGRIVATDLPEAISPGESAAPASRAENRAVGPVIQPAAFGVSLDLEAAGGLLETLDQSGFSFDLEDVLLRAVGQSIAEVLDAAAAVALDTATERRLIGGTGRLALSAVRKRRLGEVEEPTSDAAAVLSLRFMEAHGLRPILMPLTDGHAMRLVIVLDRDRGVGECLLVFDPTAIDEDKAISLLDGVTARVEAPLRLLA